MFRKPELALVKIAEINGTIVGYMMGFITKNVPVYETEKIGEISDAYISPSYRKQGLGKRLFESLRDWFEEQGINQVEVSASARNIGSNQFWEKMGFRPYMNNKVNHLSKSERR